MLDDQPLISLLDTNVERAMAKIKANQTISIEEAIPLLLKAQFNHIAHLDKAISEIVTTMATKDDLSALAMATKEDLKRIDEKFEKRFEQVDEKFEKIDQKFEKIDQRFEENRRDLDKKFEENRRELGDKIQHVDNKISTQLYWILGTMIAVGGILAGLMKF